MPDGSWWQQFTGEGIVGDKAGKKLEPLSAFIISFEDFKNAHPDGKVLSRDTGFSRNYGQNPYAGYDRADNPPFLFDGADQPPLKLQQAPFVVTLSHRGVLFPDELPEFGHTVLEVSRQPIEDKVVTISRAQGSVSYPANIMFVSAMNPCPCGFSNDPGKKC